MGFAMNRANHKRQLLAQVFRGAALANSVGAVTVQEVMTPHPTSISPHCSARELVQIFHETRFRHLLVTEHERLLGLISDRDVVRLFGLHDSPEHEFLATLTAGELMSTNLITTVGTAPLVQAIGLVVDNGIRCLPVVAGERAVGILTATDFNLSLEQLLAAVATR